MKPASVSIVTWNVEWRHPNSADAAVIRERILSCDPDVVCLTEAHSHFFGGGGYVIEAEADYGYPIQAGRRKVLLWSKTPWAAIDRTGHPQLPGGRYVAGKTTTSLGPLTVMGVCIPWADAHVKTGRQDRDKWEDHVSYLMVLAGILAKQVARTVLAGDFNQRIPRSRAPAPVFEALERKVLSRMQVATVGPLKPLGEQAIDHIAHSYDLRAREVHTLSNYGSNGRQLSDHFGVHAALEEAPGTPTAEA